MYRLRVCRRHGAAPALHPVGNRAGPLRSAPPALRNADATTDGTSNPARSFALGKPGRAARSNLLPALRRPGRRRMGGVPKSIFPNRAMLPARIDLEYEVAGSASVHDSLPVGRNGVGRRSRTTSCLIRVFALGWRIG